mgnify:CR=1 FL=1|tara:strand:- start:4446 stop:4967 length:522 start_codon:yes stop_codon:yes gene_type:complete
MSLLSAVPTAQTRMTSSRFFPVPKKRLFKKLDVNELMLGHLSTTPFFTYYSPTTISSNITANRPMPMVAAMNAFATEKDWKGQGEKLAHDNELEVADGYNEQGYHARTPQRTPQRTPVAAAAAASARARGTPPHEREENPSRRQPSRGVKGKAVNSKSHNPSSLRESQAQQNS